MAGRLALFDFDGTITHKDTLFQFILFYHGLGHFLAGLAALSPVLAAHKLGFITNTKAKESVLRFFFGGTPEMTFNAKCIEFAQTRIPSLIRASALEQLTQELENKSKVVVVSASPENWVRPWCDALGVHCLATRLEVIDQRISGKISGKNCYGKEKVSRILEAFPLADFDHIVAFGDSKGDREMLQIANESHYQFFEKPS